MAVVLAIVFRVSQEGRGDIFKRSFNLLKAAFLFPAFGRTIVALDYAGLEVGSVPVSDVQLFTNFVTSRLLAIAFTILYVDWRREPVSDSPHEA